MDDENSHSCLLPTKNTKKVAPPNPTKTCPRSLAVVLVFVYFVCFVGSLQNNPFILQFWIVSEVHQQPKSHLRCMEIVQQLGSMLIHENRDRLHLDNNLFETNEVRSVPLP